ncbi:hypothetical protein [Cognatiluteimonas weifangensis]|uniref:hypothetical protein n=1 Tax=Cognatiluteimonas weifangensis TaxID=2303539 RepID=UPI0011C123E8|nr:hypothetical protein [Luteimonas weifangensis]
MAQVSAFVAHSFSAQDEEHVNKFLGFLSHLSEINSGFSWAHALVAKPQDLREKVLEAINDKNLLIAICSRHSYSISPSDVRSGWIGSNVKFSKDDLVWTASEWIIQEIGLAFGRGMNLVLLVEEGVRKPGGLQGNIEYIDFVRKAPERSFVRLMEMINALISASPDQGVVGDANTPEEDSQKPPQVLGSEGPPPSSSLSLNELEHGWFMALLHGDEAGQVQFKDAFLTSSHGASSVQRARWDSRENWLKQLVNGNGSIDEVRRLREEWPNDSEIAMNEARLFEQMEEYSVASRSFLIAAENELDPKTKVKYLTSAAAALTRSDRFDQAQKTLQSAREVVSSSNDHALMIEFMRAFPSIYEAQEKLTKVAALEVLLEGDPGDHAIRFDLAYLYGELEMQEMAFFHYGRIPRAARSSGAWNNFGVAAGALKLSGVSINAYTQAGNAGNTLAISNKARRQRDVGLYDEAEAACRAALMIADCDSQVAETLSSIATLKEKEQKIVSEIRTRSAPISEFMRSLGRACATSPIPISGSFDLPECSCVISVRGEDFELLGSYKRQGGLASLIGRGQSENTLTLKFLGKRYGNAVMGKVTRTPAGVTKPTILGDVIDESRFCLYFDGRSDTLQIIELGSSASKSKRYTATRSS